MANGNGDSVLVYPVGTTGNKAPSQYIGGSNTELSDPDDVALDSSGNIYVTNYSASSVTIYAAGSMGNVTPTAVIAGSSTGVDHPLGVAIDALNGDIYVGNLDAGPSGNGTITFYAPGSNGNVEPLGTITGSNTGLGISGALALDPSGNIYAPNERSITVYAAGSVGNVAPNQTISGKSTKLEGPGQVAFDSSLNIYASNFADNYGIYAYAAGANGNVAPILAIAGKKTKIDNQVSGVALDADNNIYASIINDTIAIYPAGSNGNVKPSGTINGKKTELDGPRGITIH